MRAGATWHWNELRRWQPVIRVQTLLARFTAQRLACQLSPRPIVSFTFDDFPRSAATVAGDILGEYGIKATYYAAMGLVGKRTAVGEMFTLGDLEKVAMAGHELACHTLAHTRCCDVSRAEMVSACRENQRRIGELFGGRRLSNFSFPEGVVTPRAKRSLALMYDTCRTVKPGVNRDPVDLAFLKAYPIYSGSGVAKVQEIISRNRDEYGWVILYTHDVIATPSAYGCTPLEFREVVRCAVRSGSDLLPVAEATKRFQPIVQRCN